MRGGIKIVTQSAWGCGHKWKNVRVFSHRVGMAELRQLLRYHKPIAVGCEEGRMTVHFPPLLFTRRAA